MQIPEGDNCNLSRGELQVIADVLEDMIRALATNTGSRQALLIDEAKVVQVPQVSIGKEPKVA